MTPTEQKYRDEVGQLTHRNLKLAKQADAMRRDLTGQRDDMQRAIDALIEGRDSKAALGILRASLQYRADNRTPRKAPVAPTAPRTAPRNDLSVFSGVSVGPDAQARSAGVKTGGV